MPNYRYHTPESNRRGYCGCSSNMNGRNQQQSNSRPQRKSCEVPYRDCDCDTAGEMSCAVKGRYDTLDDMAVAMAYVPWQIWRNVLDAEKGLCCGTIFEDLNKPFRGSGGVRK